MSGQSYTLVKADGSPGYVSPHVPTCPATERYMVVHRVVDGGWGIVDRRTGRLLKEAETHEHHYVSWGAAQDAARALNSPASH